MSISCLPKVAVLPLEGDEKGNPILTMYNPKELSFKKEAGWGASENVNGVDLPCPSFSSGKPITMTIEFYFDLYELKLDVRPIVARLVKLCEAQACEDEKKPHPPLVQFVWRDTNPLVAGQPFTCVIKSADVKYTMFLAEGTPCRASVTLTCEQAEALVVSKKDGEGESTMEITTAGLSASALVAMGADTSSFKIEDPSTWPPTVTVPVSK